MGIISIENVLHLLEHDRNLFPNLFESICASDNTTIIAHFCTICYNIFFQKHVVVKTRVWSSGFGENKLMWGDSFYDNEKERADTG